MLEADYEQSQTDLRLAFKRITDLQAVIEEEMESGDDDSDYRFVHEFVPDFGHSCTESTLAQVKLSFRKNSKWIMK